MSTAIELRGVEKNFGITSVIRNVNLTVAQGERHALIGPNGAGKSTLFNLISGYMVPSAGSILLRDEVVVGPAALPDQPPRAVAQLSGHQRLRQYERVGKPALRRAVGRRLPLYVLEEHRQSAGSARADRPDPQRYQPDGAGATCRPVF